MRPPKAKSMALAAEREAAEKAAITQEQAAGTLAESTTAEFTKPVAPRSEAKEGLDPPSSKLKASTNASN